MTHDPTRQYNEGDFVHVRTRTYRGRDHGIVEDEKPAIVIHHDRIGSDVLVYQPDRRTALCYHPSDVRPLPG